MNDNQIRNTMMKIAVILKEDTDEPEQAMAILANLIAYMFVTYGDGTVQIEDLMEGMTEQVTVSVRKNLGKAAHLRLVQ